MNDTMSAPRPALGVLHGIAMMVGIVIGIGIFKTPPLIAANVSSEAAFLGVWALGGFITLIGALCYAELAAAHPHAGGEYHFLQRAYGRQVAVLFGWARASVIQTGAIAAVGFVLGDYVSQVVPLGPYGNSIVAAAAVVALTALNIRGTVNSAATQNWLTVLTVMVMLGLAILGLSAGAGAAAGTAPASPPSGPGLGLALILVLLTYGGWNEAAYLSAETRDPGRNMIRILVVGTALLTSLYILVNLGFLAALGFEGLRASQAVGADVARIALGGDAAFVLSLFVAATALSTLNATIFTGARVYYAMASDLGWGGQIGAWDARGSTPRYGLIAQACVALLLIALGAASRDGFQAMVDYTAPVFWGFLFLVGLAVIVLRWREPGRVLPFRVPLYPLPPILFCGTCLYMLHASIAYTGRGALIGLAVLAAGLPLVLLRRRAPRPAPAE